MKAFRLLALALTLCLSSAFAKNPIEVGDVAWGRNYEQALGKARETGKPIFLLFQEVPGCAGCKQFGQDVLSDPKVVDTIERNFIPLLIHNNKGGEDERVRKLYGEPAWNYQVVRFLDADGQDLIPRKDRVWSAPAVMARIDQALEAFKARSPKSPAPAAAKSATKATARVALCQYCFWTGEKEIGAISGVLTTEAGFIGGREVTLVTYDPQSVKLEELVGQAVDANVATSIYLDDPQQLPGAQKLSGYRRAPESDQKRQLQGTVFAQLTLTPEQATKVNAFARSDPQAALRYLTPEQIDQLRQAIGQR